MTSSPSESSTHQRLFALPDRYIAFLAIVLAVASLAPIWVTRHFPSQNGPWYLLQVHMLKEWNNPAREYSDYYRINWHPTPHTLHNIVVYGLHHALPLFTAEKVALSIYALLLPLSIFYFLSIVAPDRRVLGLLSFLMIHSYVFYRGYHNFTLSIPLFFFAFGFWHRHRGQIKLKQAAVMGALALLTYLAHLFTFAFLACAIGYYRLLETRSLRQGVLAALWATWPGWLLSIDYVLLVSGSANWVKPTDTSFLPLQTSVEYFVRKMFYSISFPAYVIASLPWLWVVYLLYRRLLGLRREGAGFWRGLFSDPFLVVFATVAIGYLVVPYKVVGWHYVNVRMIPFILGLMLVCTAPLAGLSRQSALRTAFMTTVAVAALGVYGLLSLKVVEMHRDVEEYVSGIAAYEGNSPLLEIKAENRGFGQIRPVTRCHEYYHIAKGGVNGSGVAQITNTGVLVIYRTYPVSRVLPRFDPGSPKESMRRIEETYEYALLWGEDEEWMKRLGEHGFVLEYHNRRLRLFRNQAAPSQVAGQRRQLGHAS